jgi:Domain of unknown function (DUF4349)
LSPDLAAVLRAETPPTPDRLRERVTRIAAVPPPAPRAIPVRRILVLGIPTALAASAFGAAAIGLVSSSSPRDEVAAREQAPPPTDLRASSGEPPESGLPPLESAPPVRKAPARRSARPAPKAAPVPRATSRAELRASPAPFAPAPSEPSGPAPSRTRAQDVQASLTVLVDGADDLSGTTQRALRATRQLGGYVVNVHYGTPEPSEGTAALRVRIPVSRVQAAIVQFSDLGRILAQQVQISDLQQPLDDLTRRIRRLERRAADARGAELARIRREIAVLRRQRIEIDRRAAFATVELGLTTHEPEKKEAPPGRLERAIDDATGVLAAELAIGAYALIVAAPVLLLLAAAFAASRAYRRFADQRLLERA